MVKLNELTSRAISVLDALNTRIDNNVLSKAATLKPQIISLAKRIQDLITLVKKILVLVEKNYGDIEAPKTVILEPLWSISVLEDKLVITRHKPRTLSISFSVNDEAVSIKSKDYIVVLKGGSVQMGRLAVRTELDPADPRELAEKQNDIRYVLREVIPAIELMSIALEKKFR